MISDLVTIGFLLLFIFWGTKRGVMKMALSAVGFTVSVVAGCLLYRPVAQLLQKAEITQGLAEKFTAGGALETLPGVMRDLPFAAEGTAELASAAAQAAVGAVSFIAVVLLVRLVLFVISVILGFAGSLPVVRQANGLGGGIAALAIGVFVEFLVFAVIAMIEVFGKTGIAAKLFDGSHVALIMYNNNPILSFLK